MEVMALLVGLHFVGALDVGAVDFDQRAFQQHSVLALHFALNGSRLPK